MVPNKHLEARDYIAYYQQYAMDRQRAKWASPCCYRSLAFYRFIGTTSSVTERLPLHILKAPPSVTPIEGTNALQLDAFRMDPDACYLPCMATMKEVLVWVFS